ncbi:MAG: hypothetical protein ACREUW_16885 [Burkholderiales bacterium]
MWRTLRIAILLFILATVAQTAWLARARVADWKETLRVVVYPIDADGSPATAQYLATLDVDRFRPIETFLRDEAARHGLPLKQPVELRLGPRVASLPPAPPRDAGPVGALLWSLRMRWWAWRHDAYDGPKPHVRLFVLYHDPARRALVPHSVGLQKGLLGVVNAFAAEAQRGPNNVVIAHELLHTFGATDKYDLATNRPAFPDGFADPARNPPYPQDAAEIMAGRIPRSPTQAEMPASLEDTVVGAKTAREINWLR